MGWRDRTRAGGRILADNARAAGLLALLGVCVAAYIALFVRPFEVREMVVLHRPAPQWNTVVFSLDADYPIREIEVVALTPEGDAGATVWKVTRADDAGTESTFPYGRPPRGMEVQTGPERLIDGQRYRLSVRAPGARGELDFEFAEGEPDARLPRRRRGG